MSQEEADKLQLLLSRLDAGLRQYLADFNEDQVSSLLLSFPSIFPSLQLGISLFSHLHLSSLDLGVKLRFYSNVNQTLVTLLRCIDIYLFALLMLLNFLPLVKGKMVKIKFRTF